MTSERGGTIIFPLFFIQFLSLNLLSPAWERIKVRGYFNLLIIIEHLDGSPWLYTKGKNIF